MTVYNLFQIDSRIRATITTINSEALRLHGRRADLTEQGLRTQWEQVTAKFAPQVDQIAAEVEEVAAALDKVTDYEVEHLLPEVPAAGLTAAQELRVARVLDRPGALEIENLPGVIRQHLQSPVATTLVEEIQLRNESVTDAYVTTILSEESALFAGALRGVQDGRNILGVLRQGVAALRNAVAISNVNGHEIDSHARPGSFIPSLQEMFGEGAQFTIGDDGNVHA